MSNFSPARSRRGPKPKWVNPCGIDPVVARQHALQNHHKITPLTNSELITSILLSAKNALVHADDFKEKFVSRIFRLKSNFGPSAFVVPMAVAYRTNAPRHPF